MTLFRDSGVVLRTYRLGEADRIIVVLTEHHGKVRAVAKGIRRTKSKFGGRLEPTSHVTMQLWQGRGDLDIIDQAETLDQFRLVREELERLNQAMGILEVADQFAQERLPDRQLYAMVVGALRALNDPAHNPALVGPAFFLKALVLDGAGPVLDACVSCGESEPEVELVAFDATEGGVLCRRCRRGRPLSSEALDLLRRILGGGLAAVLSDDQPQAAAEVAELAGEAIEIHLDRRLRTRRANVDQ